MQQHNTWRKDSDLLSEAYAQVNEGDGSWMDDLEGGRHKDMEPDVEQEPYNRQEGAEELQNNIMTSLKRLEYMLNNHNYGDDGVSASIEGFLYDLKERVSGMI